MGVKWGYFSTIDKLFHRGNRRGSGAKALCSMQGFAKVGNLEAKWVGVCDNEDREWSILQMDKASWN
jgi:hypothetical protein